MTAQQIDLPRPDSQSSAPAYFESQDLMEQLGSVGELLLEQLPPVTTRTYETESATIIVEEWAHDHVVTHVVSDGRAEAQRVLDCLGVSR